LSRVSRNVLATVGRAIIRPIYRVYEWWLWRQIRNGPFPRHVAVIPDGNRRWAKYLGMDPREGHTYGYERLKDVLDWLWDLNVKAVTIYSTSYENCVKRSREELEHLFRLLRKGIEELVTRGEIDKRRIRVKFFGRLDIVPAELRKLMKELEDYSAKYSERYLNVAVCYGGRQEIVDAVKRLVRDAVTGKIKGDIDEDVFREYLYTSHLDDGLEQPDLVIRTSGEMRISNFLLWQIAYSELYFCEAYWPEFRKIDLWRAIRSFQRRERRFGA